MINGIHSLIYTQNADKLRAFFRDTLGLRSVDVGHG
jgi:catechol 2,3-dioxygenase-like lactoylglutathione lyase family enzyme